MQGYSKNRMKSSTAAKHFAKQVIKTAQKSKKPAVSKENVKVILKGMENRVERSELDNTSMIANQIKGFENELKTLEKDKEHETGQNRRKIDEIYNLINAVNERVNKLVELKTERERKIKELEHKIKTESDTNQQEILRMEERLGETEQRYNKLKQQRKFSPTHLERIRRSIESFKRILAEKKTGAKEPSLFPEIPQPVKTRHTLKFEIPAPRRSIPAEEIKPELSALPPLGEMPAAAKEKEPEIPKVPKLSLMPKQKKTFWQKLEIVIFGKPKVR